jgi:hypothetical protein
MAARLPHHTNTVISVVALILPHIRAVTALHQDCHDTIPGLSLHCARAVNCHAGQSDGLLTNLFYILVYIVVIVVIYCILLHYTEINY